MIYNNAFITIVNCTSRLAKACCHHNRPPLLFIYYNFDK